MATKMKKYINKRLLWIVLVVLILLGIGGYFGYDRFLKTNTDTVDEPAMQTAVARQGNLAILASGTGQIVPEFQTGLGFDESGTLIELIVGVGDEVQAGQLLASLQTKDTPESIQAAIADAELAVVKAQQAIDDLYANAEISRTDAMNSIAENSQAVRDAQFQLENYTIPIYLQGMDAIEAVDQMKSELDAASKAFEPYKYLSSGDETREKYLEILNEAQSNYDAAVKRLDYEYALQVAQANFVKARQEYDKYKEGPASDELALAKAELANAQAKLILAKEDKSILELNATIEGTVIAVDANLGEIVGTTPIITLADLKQPQLEVYLDETDLDKVAVGYEAEVSFDALPDRVFAGKVIKVNPSLETVSNIQAVKVTVSLDMENINSPINLPIGLNASVDVIAGRAENAVLVPIEALRDLGGGEYAVFVVENGELKLRVVEVGLMDITSAEIKSGLAVGEIVSTGIVQTQ